MVLENTSPSVNVLPAPGRISSQPSLDAAAAIGWDLVLSLRIPVEVLPNCLSVDKSCRCELKKVSTLLENVTLSFAKSVSVTVVVLLMLGKTQLLCVVTNVGPVGV